MEKLKELKINDDGIITLEGRVVKVTPIGHPILGNCNVKGSIEGGLVTISGGGVPAVPNYARNNSDCYALSEEEVSNTIHNDQHSGIEVRKYRAIQLYKVLKE